jgi:chromosome segregation protein
LEEEVRQLNRTRQALEEVINSYRDKIGEMKVGLAGLKERLSVEFNVDLNNLADQQPSSEATYEELRDEVTDVKSKIDNYGEINPMAVEAHTEMEERFNFITGQKNDLVVARQNLEETIKEIDQTASERFMSCFESARERFKEVFKSLFNPGDDCDLVLLNPSDPLESKIEVIARPKGKRPIIINQLSGGEKALTAIALLFALYLIKPAPFCIFDEVDAPLDDANIQKFTQIINQFSKDSQFIIVTHNKQTMAAVDAIYGVTMPEQGVSRVVPVNFGSLN